MSSSMPNTGLRAIPFLSFPPSYIFWIKQAGLYPDLSTKSNRPIKSKEATLLFAFVLNHLFSRLSIEIGGGF
jgi:hypothetical protein